MIKNVLFEFFSNFWQFLFGPTNECIAGELQCRRLGMERNGEFWRIEFRRTIKGQISQNRTNSSSMFEGMAAASTTEYYIRIGGK